MAEEPEEPEIIKKKDPLDEIIDGISELLRVFNETKSKKRAGPLPEDFQKQVEMLAVEVELFSLLHANALKEVGITTIDKAPETLPRNLDPKSKRQYARLKKLTEEVSSWRQVFTPKQAKKENIKGMLGKEKTMKAKKKSINKHFGHKGWKKI